jgi:hypothetical protein
LDELWLFGRGNRWGNSVTQKKSPASPQRQAKTHSHNPACKKKSPAERRGHCDAV